MIPLTKIDKVHNLSFIREASSNNREATDDSISSKERGSKDHDMFAEEPSEDSKDSSADEGSYPEDNIRISVDILEHKLE